jgi:pimeloyl-ACP methyl ester carboxylesterase
MDHRDVGLSTHLHQNRKPSVFKMIVRPKSTASYLMAADSVAVLDDLGWKTPNNGGGSSGGRIAQTLAIEFPGRVRTLTKKRRKAPGFSHGDIRRDWLAMLLKDIF